MKASSVGIKAFLYYIHERESIRLAREAGRPWPWTKDKVLQTYKFTNVQRKHDATTKVLAAIYASNVAPGKYAQALMNCATFRYFGTSEFAQALGWQTKWSAARVLKVAKVRAARGLRCFTGAFVISNLGRSEPKEDVVVSCLEALNKWAPDCEKALKLSGTSSLWQKVAERMYSIYGFGGSGFMTKEVLSDFILCYPGLFADAATWTPVGPGARKGLNCVSGRPMDWGTDSYDWLSEVRALQVCSNQHWLEWWPEQEPLTAHDIQFCLCEHSKEVKVRTGVGRPRSLYSPIIRRAGDEA